MKPCFLSSFEDFVRRELSDDQVDACVMHAQMFLLYQHANVEFVDDVLAYRGAIE